MLSTIWGNLFSSLNGFLECLTFILPFLIGIGYFAYKQKIKISKINWLGKLLFVYIVVYMLEFTTISTLYRILYIGFEVHPETFNFIPFHSITDDPLSYITNNILFMPFGFLCPLIWRNLRSIKRVALVGFAFSCTIEIAQIFSFRVTDIDDLLMNTTGTILGCLIYKMIKSDSFNVSDYELGGSGVLSFVLKYEVWFLIYIVFGYEFLFFSI